MSSTYTTHPMQFARHVKELLKTYNRNARESVVFALRDMREDLIYNNPVYTGYSRAAWWDSAEKSTAHPRPPSLLEKARVRAIVRHHGRGSAVISTKWGWAYVSDAPERSLKTGRYWLANLAPYIGKLNASHPIARRFVDRARERFNSHLSRHLKARYAGLSG